MRCVSMRAWVQDKFGAFWAQFLGLKAQLGEDGGVMRAHERVAYLQVGMGGLAEG